MTRTNIVYAVVVIDVRSDSVLGFRRTPAIFENFKDALFAVTNNDHDMADNISYQYAVIEETQLNVIRPNLEISRQTWWFKYNAVQDKFVSCQPPIQLRTQSGFSIG